METTKTAKLEGSAADLKVGDRINVLPKGNKCSVFATIVSIDDDGITAQYKPNRNKTVAVKVVV